MLSMARCVVYVGGSFVSMPATSCLCMILPARGGGLLLILSNQLDGATYHHHFLCLLG